MQPDYTFRKAARADYPMLRQWLQEPHVASVWGLPEEEIALMDAEMDGGDCQMWIVSADRPFAFVQDWGAHEADVPHYTDQPHGARSVDTFLGDPAYLGRGHAKRYVRRYAQTLGANGAPAVLTDPRLTNPRAIAMFAGAGFKPRDVRVCEDGTDVQIMEFQP